MTSKRILAVAVVALALSASPSAQQRPAGPAIDVYKTPTCGCCSKWIDHMRAAGFRVRFVDMPQGELDKLKAKHRVPSTLASCHTALTGGYVIEGHVPATDVKRLLREKPKAVGIVVPGMPPGSPGMEVAQRPLPTYLVLLLDQQGTTRVFSTQKP